MSEKKDEEESFGSKFIKKIIWSALTLPIIFAFFPWALQIDPFYLLKPKGAVLEWLYIAWPLFTWGFLTNLVVLLLYSNPPEMNRNAEKIFAAMAFDSVRAGIIEELTCRWAFFLNAIIGVKVANFCFFGFLGFGITEWLYTHLFGPVADFTTLYALDPYLFHPTGWAIGAAILSTNAFFREGHAYQGLKGLINSWFVGMYLFWIMFHYGLIAAILIHFLYDFMIDLLVYGSLVIERGK